jgi:AsmA family protein
MNLSRLSRSRVLRGTAATLLLLIVLVAIGEAMGWPMLRTPLQRMATRAAAVPVALEGDFRLHLIFRPRVEIEHLRVGAAAGVPVPHLLEARGVTLAWRWSDLWRWQRRGEALRLHALSARSLDARLLRLADGRASWQLGPLSSTSAPGDPVLPRVGSLRVADGRIAVDDKLLDTALQVTLRGGEGEQPAQRGYRAEAQGRYRGAPLLLTASAGAVLPLLQDEAAGAQAQPVPLRLEGRIGETRLYFNGSAGALLGPMSLRGALQLTGPSLAAVGDVLGVTLPRTPPFQLGGQITHQAGDWQLRADRAVIGRSRLAGEFRYDGRTRPARLTGRLTGQRLALRDLGAAVGADVSSGHGPAPDDVLPQRPFDLASLRAMDADVQVAVDELDFNSTGLVPLQALRTRVVLERGVLQLQALHAEAAGGEVSGATRLDASREPARWFADVQFAHVDAAGWIRALQPPRERTAATAAKGASALKRERQRARQGGDQPVRSYLTGLIDAAFKVEGAGASTADILGTLGGQAQIRLRDGTLSHLATELMGIDLGQAIGVALRGDRPLPLRCAVFDLAIDQGVATTRRAVVDNADSTVRIAGRVNLRDETIAARLRVEPKDFSPLSLRAPIVISGSLAKPVVGIEGSEALGRLLAAAALGALAGPAALLPLIDPGSEETGDPCAQPTPASAKPVQQQR